MTATNRGTAAVALEALAWLDRGQASLDRTEALLNGQPRLDVIEAAVRAGYLSGDAMRVPDEVCVDCQTDAYPCKRRHWHVEDDPDGVRHVHVRLTESEWTLAQRRLVEEWPRRTEIMRKG
jgi:hypothetical protein